MRTLRIVNSVREFEFDTKQTLQHSGGAQFSVKSLRIEPVSPRLGAKDRYGRDGSIVTGDRKVSARSIDIGLNVTVRQELGDRPYREFIDDLLSMFDPRYEPVYLYDDQDDAGPDGIPLRAMVELERENLTPEKDGLDMIILTGTLGLLMIDGYWETQDEYETSSGTGGIANGEVLNVANGSRRTAYPVIEVTALSDNELFRLSNSTTGAYIEIGASDFYAGETITISSIDGTILLGGTDISASAIGEGSTMLDLVPGANTILYESAYGPVEMTVRWRERWLR